MLVIPMFLMFVGGLGAIYAAEDSKTIEYHCTGSAAGLLDIDIPMDVAISAEVPDSVAAGEDFTIENSYTNISMEATDILKTAANPLEGEVTEFNLELNNATARDTGEDFVNVADEALSFGPIDIADDDEVVEFRVPEEGGIDVDLTAGESGEVVVNAGTIENTVQAGLSGIELDVDVTCDPTDDQDTILNEIAIIEDDEEPALDDINEAEQTEDMQAALENEELELNLDAYDELSEDEQADVSTLMLENRPDDGYSDVESVQNALDEAVEEVADEKDDPATEEALEQVNEADNAQDMWAALENEDLNLNLSAIEDYNTYRQMKIAEWILNNRPDEGYEVGYADEDDEKFDNSVQKAVSNANFELYLDPTRPDDPVELAFDEVNEAKDTEDMQAALENEDLDLNLSSYNDLSTEEQSKAAELVLENRPDDEEGYPLPKDIQNALDDAVKEVDEEDTAEPGGTWFIDEGEPSEDLGEDNDLYLDEESFDVYLKEDGTWKNIGNLKGEDGEPGDDGVTWIVDEGEPKSDEGSEGDLYLDTETGDVYLKEDGEWKKVASLQGDDGKDGEDGTTWLHGKGEPKDDVGSKDDFYLDTETGDVYVKGEEGWEHLLNLKGEDGKDGKDGEQGEDGKDCDCEDDQSNGMNDSDDQQKKNGTKSSDNDNGGKLPKTATNNPLIILIGSLLAIVGGALIFIRKKALN